MPRTRPSPPPANAHKRLSTINWRMMRKRVAQSEEHGQFIEKVRYNSAAVAPLVARGRVLGTLSILHVASDHRYDPEDLDVLDDLAVRAALALDNARLYSDRDEIARVLQRELRPPDPTPIPGPCPSTM